jgi:hypothetical protein
MFHFSAPPPGGVATMGISPVAVAGGDGRPHRLDPGVVQGHDAHLCSARGALASASSSSRKYISSGHRHRDRLLVHGLEQSGDLGDGELVAEVIA